MPSGSAPERARAEICRRVGEEVDSVAEVARAFGVGWHTAKAAARDHARERVDHSDRPASATAIGVDETVCLPACQLLDSLRINFGRIESFKALDTVNASANQLALAAMLRGRVVLAKTIGARLSPLMD